ncbi:MAG: CHAT domain-containing protein, partial [Planctomycetota bacterium]|nr:CHAT domain-containing protein [Planctomycetota bacterium]
MGKLVEPWVATMPNSKEKQASGNEKDSDVAQARREEQARKKLHGVLQLVTPASLDDLRQKLQQESFTHIHILAHGCVRPRGDKNDPRELGQPKFGIAFHDQRHTPGEIDVVDGNRLAEVLRSGSACRGKLRPAVVTLAICDSSAQGDVVGAGGSVAFELHDAGIPLVVASQFPFSFEGSILLTDSLYRGFLCGEDPRRTLWDTRRRLHSGLPELMSTDGKPHRPAPHDWASLTVFAAFPDNLDQVLPAHQRDRQRTRMNACLENLDQWLDDFYDNKWNWGHEANSRERWNNIERELQTASERVTEFNNWVD